MPTLPSLELARFYKRDVTIETALRVAAEQKTTIDHLKKTQLKRAPPEFRKKPFGYVMRRLNIEQIILAERARISISSANNCFTSKKVRLTTACLVAHALKWSVHDICEMIITQPEPMTKEDFQKAIEAMPGSLNDKATRLGVNLRSLQRWLKGDRNIPADMKQRLDDLRGCL